MTWYRTGRYRGACADREREVRNGDIAVWAPAPEPDIRVTSTERDAPTWLPWTLAYYMGERHTRCRRERRTGHGVERTIVDGSCSGRNVTAERTYTIVEYRDLPDPEPCTYSAFQDDGGEQVAHSPWAGTGRTRAGKAQERRTVTRYVDTRAVPNCPSCPVRTSIREVSSTTETRWV